MIRIRVDGTVIKVDKVDYEMGGFLYKRLESDPEYPLMREVGFSGAEFLSSEDELKFLRRYMIWLHSQHISEEKLSYLFAKLKDEMMGDISYLMVSKNKS